MKTLFQLLLVGASLAMMIDIGYRGIHQTETEKPSIEGQFIDVVTQEPVGAIRVSMKSEKGNHTTTLHSDEEGNFILHASQLENQDYSLYVQDQRYRIVNPNQRVSARQKQIWYLLPVSKPN
ncbi:MAG: hypothetical protein LPK45_10505 [Bacteroidota bacterium]|nr:hypothetical protein [Bacteroidota bacterium]MDX5431529.1 hypothetical protein [Bacteroidota bacterium]MDX5470250.1 hypothetical protein [Bacteroidota bacterium]